MSRTRQCATVTTRTPRHREFRKRPSVVVRFSSRWDFRPIRRKILNFSATRRETTRANEWLCGFWPTARRSLHATNTATSPCSLHETGTRRGRRCPHHDAVGGVPIGGWCGRESATRAACGPSRVQKRMPVAPAFTPGAAIRVAASSAGHRAPARGGAPPRACASRAPRCDRTNPSRRPRTPTAVP